MMATKDMDASMEIQYGYDYIFWQFRFPRSKKRRVRKKWTGRVSNWKHRIENAFVRTNDDF